MSEELDFFVLFCHLIQKQRPCWASPHRREILWSIGRFLLGFTNQLNKMPNHHPPQRNRHRYRHNNYKSRKNSTNSRIPLQTFWQNTIRNRNDWASMSYLCKTKQNKPKNVLLCKQWRHFFFFFDKIENQNLCLWVESRVIRFLRNLFFFLPFFSFLLFFSAFLKV